jgi:hypothetical protein
MRLLFSISIGIGAGLVFASCVSGFLSLGRSLLFRKRIRLRREKKEEKIHLSLFSPLLLPLFFLLGGVVGYVLFADVLPILAVGVGFLFLLLPSGYVRWKKKMERMRVRREVRDFIQDLRLALGVFPSVSLALEEVRGRGELGKRLEEHKRSLLLLEGPFAVLEALHKELESEELAKLIEKIKVAEKGGDTFEHALSRASKESQEELERDVELEIKEAPMRLLVPMLFLLLPPILIFVLWPLASVVIKGLVFR